MSQQLLKQKEQAEDIKSEIQALAEKGGINLGYLSAKRRHELVSRLQKVSQPYAGLYSPTPTSPGEY